MSLHKYFQPAKYSLSLSGNSCQLIIEGKKLPPPSKRITLHQKGLKITAAKIIRKDKKGPSGHEVLRINHLPTFEEVRIHTKDLLYPGHYQIDLAYELSPQKAKSLAKQAYETLHRDLLPCIDEPEAWAGASFEIK